MSAAEEDKETTKLNAASVEDELREVFQLFDVDGDGSITHIEVGRVLNRLGKKFDEAEVKAMIARIDKDGNGEIDFLEFLLMMTDRVKNLHDVDEMKECFQVFDADGNGYITPEELCELMKSVGENITQEDIKLMIGEADQNDDGLIDFEEFQKMIQDGP
eukprot:182773_1